MNVLVIFSNPPDLPRIRLDKEDKIFKQLEKQFPGVKIVCQHASEIDDVHALITRCEYDVIQFSGHGSSDGIYLEKSDIDCSELVSPTRLQSLIQLAERSPRLVILLNCYSGQSATKLANIAPFVITAIGKIADDACILFVKGFYEFFFKSHSIQASFDHALSLLAVREFPVNTFQLSRRHPVRHQNSYFVHCYPSPNRDSILVNLDAVTDKLSSFGMSTEELCHLLVKKLCIHYWIFDSARERAIIPIGRLLFGEFSWKDTNDVVYCRKIMKLRSDISRRHWEIWSRLLMVYNDLASCEYRTIDNPADLSNQSMLENAIRLFKLNINKYIKPLRDETIVIDGVNLDNIFPHVEFVITSVDRAADQLELSRYPQVITELEIALSNLHEIVDYLQPPEEIVRN